MLGLDTRTIEIFHNLTGHSQWVNWIVVFFAQYLVYILILVFVYFVLQAPQGRRLYLFSLAILSVILSRGILTEIIHFFFFRPRPFVTLSFMPLIYQPSTEASFPSGHMTLLVPICLALWQLSRKKGAWFLGLTVIVGMARIASGVHWPSDIVGGLVIGAASFALVKLFFREIDPSASAVSKVGP